MTDPQQVLLYWALPLLARARLMADRPDRTSPEAWRLLADDITDLIGHPASSRPAAGELADIRAAAAPPRRRGLIAGRAGTRGYYDDVRGVSTPPAAEPEDRTCDCDARSGQGHRLACRRWPV